MKRNSTGNETDNPWRTRNLERLAQARRILTEARHTNLKGPTMSEPTAPDEEEPVSTPDEVTVNPDLDPEPEPEPDEADGGDQ